MAGAPVRVAMATLPAMAKTGNALPQGQSSLVNSLPSTNVDACKFVN